MFGHIAEPLDAEASGGLRVQAFGDGVGDDGLAFFFQQFNQPPLLTHQPVNLRRLPIQKPRYRRLLVTRRTTRSSSRLDFPTRSRHLRPERRAIHDRDKFTAQ